MYATNCTQQLYHGTNKLYAHKYLKPWSTCVTRSYNVRTSLSLPKLRPHGLHILSHDHLYQVCCTQSYMHIIWRLALSCTVNFPPQQLPWIYIPDYFILLILCWTLDSGLNYGLDYGMDYGLDYGLDFGLDIRNYKLTRISRHSCRPVLDCF